MGGGAERHRAHAAGVAFEGRAGGGAGGRLPEPDRPVPAARGEQQLPAGGGAERQRVHQVVAGEGERAAGPGGRSVVALVERSYRGAFRSRGLAGLLQITGVGAEILAELRPGAPVAVGRLTQLGYRGRQQRAERHRIGHGEEARVLRERSEYLRPGPRRMLGEVGTQVRVRGHPVPLVLLAGWHGSDQAAVDGSLGPLAALPGARLAAQMDGQPVMKWPEYRSLPGATVFDHVGARLVEQPLDVFAGGPDPSAAVRRQRRGHRDPDRFPGQSWALGPGQRL